jgi:ABC-type branched-subunit amino acid transport system ATPase component
MVKTSALNLDGVSKSYGGVRAVQNASLSVESGSVHGLIGPNGAGKSTLIGLITGFIATDSGQSTFEKTRIDSRSPADIAKLGISRTFQQATPILGLTVLENVMVGLHAEYRASLSSVLFRTSAMRREAHANRERAERLLQEFGLGDDADAPAADLPFGKLRFLEIARSVAHRPRILLLDEPAAGLNAVETERLGGLVRRLSTSGIGILLVDHDVPFVFGLCDTVTVMNFGSVIASGDASTVYREPAVREAYLGAPDHPREGVECS